MTASSPHWARMGETTFVAGIRFLCLVERGLGRWPFRLCLAPVVLAHWVGNGVARRASLEYLRRLQSSCRPFDREPGAWMSLCHFVRFAETLLDKLLASRGRYPPEKVRVEREVMLAGGEMLERWGLSRKRASEYAMDDATHNGLILDKR